MAVENRCFTAQERAEQLKACCQTIIDNAEKIVKDIDLTINRKITIDIPSREFPTITVEQEFFSKKMLDCLNK